MSPFLVMWIVSVEINRSVCRHAQTVRRSLPDAPDASTRAFTLQSQADANRSRPLRTHPDVVWVYRTNPTQWTQCVYGQPDANHSRTVRASGKIVSVCTRPKAAFTLGPVMFQILANRTRRVDFASDLHSHYKRLTRRERNAHISPWTHCVCFATGCNPITCT